MSVENICVLSTVVLPYAMLFENKTIKSYVYLISFLGGILALFLPLCFIHCFNISSFT